MAINTDMSGKTIDKTLKAFLNAQNTDNNGKIICIRNGKLAFEDGDDYFTIAEWEEST